MVASPFRLLAEHAVANTLEHQTWEAENGESIDRPTRLPEGVLSSTAQFTKNQF